MRTEEEIDEKISELYEDKNIVNRYVPSAIAESDSIKACIMLLEWVKGMRTYL